MGSVCASRDDAKVAPIEKDLQLKPPETPRSKSRSLTKRATSASSGSGKQDHDSGHQHHHGENKEPHRHGAAAAAGKEHPAHDRQKKAPAPPAQAPKAPKAELWDWQDHLPLPMPALISLLVGAVGGHYLQWHVFIGLFVLVCAVTPIVYGFLMGVIGRSIKGVVETIDQKILGVDVHLGKIDVSLCYGIVTITDLVIDNPEPFKCEYLLKAAKVTIDVDVQELILSRGMHIVIEELELDEVDAIVEFTTMCMTGKNNFDVVVEHLERFKPAEGSKAGRLMRKMSSLTEALAQKQKVSLRKVGVVDLGAKVTNQTIGTRIACSDIRHKNFEEEVGANAADEVIHCLVSSICKSILVNIGGRAFR